MANTYVDYTAVATQTDYNFSFEYLRDAHVKVKVNGSEVTNFTIVTSPVQLIRFDTAPVANADIKIYRDSRGDFSPLVDFVDGSILTENELDESYKHNLFIGQEASEGQGGEQLTKKGLEHYDAEGNKIINLFTPSDATDAANKAYVDDTIDTAIALGGSPAIVSLGGYDVTALDSTTPRSLADRFANIYHVFDFMTEAEINAVENNDYTSVTDVTTAIRTATTAIQTAGGGTLDFGGANNTFKVFTGSIETDPVPLGSFNSITGIYLKSAGAKFIIAGDFPVDAVRAKLFSFEGCSNITIGDFVVDATGDRTTGGANPTLGLYRRGGVAFYFQGTNSNVVIGNLDITDISIGVWFYSVTYGSTQPKTAAVDINTNDVTSFVDIANIKAHTVGYPMQQDSSGHFIKFNLNAVECGRAWYCVDVLNAVANIVSKDQDGSNDVGMAGWVENIDLSYTNTESGDIGGNCVSLNIGSASEYTNHKCKNIKVKVNCNFTAQTNAYAVFELGLSTGVTLPRDTGFTLEGLDYSGSVRCSNNLMRGFVFEEINVGGTSFTDGSHYSGINIHDLTVNANENNLIGMRYVKDVARITNVYTSGGLSFYPNTTGKTVFTNVDASEIFDSVSKSLDGNVEVYGSNIRAATHWDWTKDRGVYNTNFGASSNAQRSTLHLGGGSFQTFCLEINNNSGTLEHRIVNSRARSTLPDSQYISNFSGFSSTYATLPSVNGSTDFTNGVGYDAGNTQIVLNNVNAQDIDLYQVVSNLLYYDGNVHSPNVEPFINSMDVNGTTQFRLHLKFTNSLTGASWDVNTTNIPAGKKITVQVLGWII
jgi:hypothetical protein